MHEIADYLGVHDFKSLFVESLGWDRGSGTTALEQDGLRFVPEMIAHKRGIQILHCPTDHYTLFNRRRLRGLQRQLLKLAHEHVVVYSCDQPRKQVWQWAVHLPDGRKVRHREHPFFSSSPPEPLLQRIAGLRFRLEEEEQVTLFGGLDRVRRTLDTEADLNLFASKPWYAEQSDRLAQAMRTGGDAAFRAFVEFHLPMAAWGAKEWSRYFRGLDEEDRQQIAVIGLLQAARRFDPSRGFQFSTYAYHWIRQACSRHGPDAANPISIPIHVVPAVGSLRRHLARAESTNGTEASLQHLAAAAERDPRTVQSWRHYCTATSLRTYSDPKEPEAASIRLVLDEGDRPLDEVIRREDEMLIEAVLATLPEIDAKLIRRKFGFEGQGETLQELGNALGVTRERIRQRLLKATRKIGPLLHKKLGLPPSMKLKDEPEEEDSANAFTASDPELAGDGWRLLNIVRRHPAGIGGVELSAASGLGRTARKSALRRLVLDGLVAQIGRGRAAVYLPSDRTSDTLSVNNGADLPNHAP